MEENKASILKIKSELLEQRGVNWIILDILKVFDNSQGNSRDTEDYIAYINMYKNNLKRELDKRPLEDVIQKDLETEIQEIKELTM